MLATDPLSRSGEILIGVVRDAARPLTLAEIRSNMVGAGLSQVNVVAALAECIIKGHLAPLANQEGGAMLRYTLTTSN